MESKQTENAEKQTEKIKKKPFKQTRELVRLALNNGWTQIEIAKTCRTQQSVVSSWSRGEKLGTEQQLKPLLDLFGYKLRRNTFRLYWRKNAETSELEFIRVEGKIIFNLTIGKYEHEYRRKKFIPKFKFIIHHQGNNQIYLILEKKIHYLNDTNLNDANLDNAQWEIAMNIKITIDELILLADKLSHFAILCQENRNIIFSNTPDFLIELIKNFPDYVESLPFLIRQALLNHGLPVNDVIECPASW